MKSREEFEKIFNDLAIYYNLQYVEIKEIFIDSLSKIFKDDVIEIEKQDNNNYGFYIFKNSTFKKISFSQRIEKDLNLVFKNEIINFKNCNLKNKLKQIKNTLIPGEVVKIEDKYLQIKTNFLICKAPKNLMQIQDLEKLHIGDKFIFRIHKYSFLKGSANVILTRIHREIDTYYVKLILKDYDIKYIKRFYNNFLKIHINKRPTKGEVSDLKLFFKNEKIQFTGFKKNKVA